MNISREGRIVLSDVRYVDETFEGEFPRIMKDDIIFNNTNSIDLVGKTAIVESSVNWTYSNHMTMLRFPSYVSSRFFALQIHYLWMTGYFRPLLTQHINQASVGKRTLSEEVSLAIPPAPEQQRIVGKTDVLLGKLNDSLGYLERARRNAVELNKSIIRVAVTGVALKQHADVKQELERDVSVDLPTHDTLLSQIDHLALQSSSFALSEHDQHTSEGSSTDIPYPLPEGWSWSTVRDVGDVRLGKQRSPRTQGGTHIRPYLRVANVFEDQIDTTDLKEMNFLPREYDIFRVYPNDILLNEGQSIELVGRPAMFRGEVEDVCFQNTLIRFRSNDLVEPEFALLVFRHYFHAGHFQSVARWSTNIAHLGLHRFAALPFPLPPVQDQKRIAADARRQLSVIAAQQASLSSLLNRAQALRLSILADAFSGKLASQELQDGHAEDLLLQLRKDSRAYRARKPRRGPPRSRARKGATVRKNSPRPIYEVLLEAKGILPTSVLFERCGYDHHTIDHFYEHLKLEVQQGRLREVRSQVSSEKDVLHPSSIELTC